jgi:hypothetical protein
VETTLDDLVAMYSGDRPDHAMLSEGVVAPVLSESDGPEGAEILLICGASTHATANAIASFRSTSTIACSDAPRHDFGVSWHCPC